MYSCSPQSHKESDTTEWLNNNQMYSILHVHTQILSSVPSLPPRRFKIAFGYHRHIESF